MMPYVLHSLPAREKSPQVLPAKLRPGLSDWVSIVAAWNHVVMWGGKRIKTLDGKKRRFLQICNCGCAHDYNAT